MRLGEFARSVLGTSGANLLSALIALVTGIVLARALGPDGRGILAFVLLIPSIQVMLGNFGIGAAAVYYLGQGDYSRESTFRNLAAWHRLLGGLLCLLGVLILLAVPGIPHKSLIALACPIVFFDLGFRLFSSYAIAIKRTALYNIASVSRSVTFLLGCSITYWADAISTTVVVAIGVLASFVSFSILFLPLRGELSGIAWIPRFEWVRSTVGYGKILYAANLLNFANYKLDRLIIFYFLTEYELGLYAVAATIAESIWMLPNASSLILFPRIAVLDSEQSAVKAKRVCSFSVWIVAALAISVIGAAYWCIPILYGERFAPAFMPLAILAVGAIPFSMFKVLSAYFSGTGNQNVVLRISVLTATLNLVANILLVPHFGIVGAACASAISYVAGGIAAVWYASEKSGSPAIDYLFDKRAFSIDRRTGY